MRRPDLTLETSPVALRDLHPRTAMEAREVLAGLRANPKSLPPKYFYDREGSRLFEEICDQPEYYPTRTEIAILEARADALANRLGREVLLIEYGSGSSRKTRILLDCLPEPVGYVPVEISRAALEGAVEGLLEEYPGLSLYPVCADYMELRSLPFADLPEGKRVLFFPGSTIGNLHPREAVALLRNMRAVAGPGCALVLGVDLRKDAAVLERAYNDRRGVTAAFNLNLLRHVNKALEGDLPLDAFRHRAFFNARLSRIEMHLVATRAVTARVAGKTVRFGEGESLHTENSYKYSAEEFTELLKGAGFEASAAWTDPRKYFCVFYAESAR
ncbi:MAG: L-histidine N(alpha)-methyltransferase [Fibrobacteria bacterium]|jgi:dimethylhistidine N-methyltransferase|nr:L-histidine N(alpha)-methyltransferase [Fibrobacteria bacterium]